MPVITPAANSRCFSVSFGRSLSVCLSEQARSRLMLVALTVMVVGGYAFSMLSLLIFSSALSNLHISASDLTPYLNGW